MHVEVVDNCTVKIQMIYTILTICNTSMPMYFWNARTMSTLIAIVHSTNIPKALFSWTAIAMLVIAING